MIRRDEREERKCSLHAGCCNSPKYKKRKRNIAIYTCLDRYTSCAQHQQQYDLLDKLENLKEIGDSFRYCSQFQVGQSSAFDARFCLVR
jgi:hypothetical protein